MKNKNNRDESDFNENEIPDLNSWKAFEFEPKTNIGDINSSSSDREEVAEYEVKWISNSKWFKCRSCWQMFFKMCVRPATLLERDSNTSVFL